MSERQEMTHTTVEPTRSKKLASAGCTPFPGLPTAPWIEDPRPAPEGPGQAVWTGEQWERLDAADLDAVRPCAGVLPGARARRGKGKHVPWSILDRKLLGVIKRRGRTGDAWIWDSHKKANATMEHVRAQSATCADLGRADLRVPAWLRAEYWSLTANELILCATLVNAYEVGWGGVYELQSTLASDLGFSERCMRNILNGTKWKRADGTPVYRPGLVERGLVDKTLTFKAGDRTGKAPPSVKDWLLLRPAGVLEHAAAWHAFAKRWTPNAPRKSGYTRRRARVAIRHMRMGAAGARRARAGRAWDARPERAMTADDCLKPALREGLREALGPIRPGDGHGPGAGVVEERSPPISEPCSSSSTSSSPSSSPSSSTARSTSSSLVDLSEVGEYLADLGKQARDNAGTIEPGERSAVLEHYTSVRDGERRRGEHESCCEVSRRRPRAQTCAAVHDVPERPPITDRQDLPIIPPVGGPLRAHPNWFGCRGSGGVSPPAQGHPPENDARKRAAFCSNAPAHGFATPGDEARRESGPTSGRDLGPPQPPQPADRLPRQEPRGTEAPDDGDGLTALRLGSGGRRAVPPNIGVMREDIRPTPAPGPRGAGADRRLGPVDGECHRSDVTGWCEADRWLDQMPAGDPLADLLRGMVSDYD